MNHAEPRHITNALLKISALSNVAGAVAATDPDRAEHVLEGIGAEPRRRGRGFRVLVDMRFTFAYYSSVRQRCPAKIYMRGVDAAPVGTVQGDYADLGTIWSVSVHSCWLLRPQAKYRGVACQRDGTRVLPRGRDHLGS